VDGVWKYLEQTCLNKSLALGMKNTRLRRAQTSKTTPGANGHHHQDMEDDNDTNVDTAPQSNSVGTKRRHEEGTGLSPPPKHARYSKTPTNVLANFIEHIWIPKRNLNKEDPISVHTDEEFERLDKFVLVRASSGRFSLGIPVQFSVDSLVQIAFSAKTTQEIADPLTRVPLNAIEILRLHWSAYAANIRINDVRYRDMPLTVFGHYLTLALSADSVLNNASQSMERATVYMHHKVLSNVRFSSGKGSALHHAVHTANLDMVKWILRLAPELCEIQDNHGRIPLWYAVGSHSNSAIADLLLRCRAINTKSNNGMTPLHQAAAYGNTKTVHILIKALSKGSVLTRGGCCGHLHTADNSGKTPLHYAASKGRSSLCSLFLYEGSDPLIRCRHNKTPLWYAMKHGRFGTAKLLLSQPIAPPSTLNMNTPEKQKWKNLQDDLVTFAAGNILDVKKAVEMLCVLKSKGVMPHTGNCVVSCMDRENGADSVLHTLLNEMEANPFASIKGESTCAWYHFRNERCLRVIMDHCKKMEHFSKTSPPLHVSPFQYVVTTGNLGRFDILFQNLGRLNISCCGHDANGNNLLHTIAKHGDEDFFDSLEYNMEGNDLLDQLPSMAQESNRSGNTPFMASCESDNLTVCKKLFKLSKPDATHTNQDGNNCLHLCGGAKTSNLCSFLYRKLPRGAFCSLTHVRNSDGLTPSELSLNKGSTRVADRLRRYNESHQPLEYTPFYTTNDEAIVTRWENNPACAGADPGNTTRYTAKKITLASVEFLDCGDTLIMKMEETLHKGLVWVWKKGESLEFSFGHTTEVGENPIDVRVLGPENGDFIATASLCCAADVGSSESASTDD
jgi:ankyrin repeat protein